jgi:glutathione S-transferase
MPDHIDPPHATGRAADTVKAHLAEHSLVFHAVSVISLVGRA